MSSLLSSFLTWLGITSLAAPIAERSPTTVAGRRRAADTVAR